MKSALFMLTILLTHNQPVASCPASCVVCSEETFICHKLSSFIDVPETTQALFFTDGWIQSVDNSALGDISNVTVLSLSNNAITTIKRSAFQSLTVLQTLLLDHNHITSWSLDRSTFSWLSRLETLQLGNNDLQEIDGSWFQNTSRLKSLQFESNLIAWINSSTFASSNLRGLENLDLSDNLITYLSQDSFRNLPQLRRLDLSRNKLQNAPDAFSYLSWLSTLNLDMNQWNCTCELRELASFLSSYVQAPNKALYNGQRMICSNADNPAVKAVLELTEANCVPPNQNITVQVVAKSAITPQRYTRDVALAAVLFFAGGIGITLGLLGIIYRKLELRVSQKRNKHSPQGSAQLAFTEENEILSAAHDVHKPKQMDPFRDGRPKRTEPMFVCHHCRSSVSVPVSDQREPYLARNTTMHLANVNRAPHGRPQNWTIVDEREASRRHGTHTESVNKGHNRHTVRTSNYDIAQHHGLPEAKTCSSKIPQIRQNGQCPIPHTNSPAIPGFRAHGNPLSEWKAKPHAQNTAQAYSTIHCMQCNRTYEYKQTKRKGHGMPNSHFDQTLEHDEPAIFKPALPGEAVLGYNQPNAQSHGETLVKDLHFKSRNHKNVTFDLSGSEGRAVQKEMSHAENIKSRMRLNYMYYKSLNDEASKIIKSNISERGRSPKRHRHKTKTSRSLKVKLNLNPLRKSRVHPKKWYSHEEEYQSDVEKSAKQDKKDRLRAKIKCDQHHVPSQSRGSKTLTGRSKKESKSHKDKIMKSSKTNKNVSNSEDLPQPDLDADLSNQNTSTLVLKNEEDQKEHPEELKRPPVHSAELTQQETSHAHPDTTGPGPAEGPSGAGNETLLSLTQATLSSSEQTGAPLNEESVPADVLQEYVSEDGSLKRKLRLIVPEKTTNRPLTALEKKIR
ncbi:quinone oxidoreductase isoform X1 [Denticeps clupeoides]|uniref:Uncharacterized protein n=1 Tax=Denticeps clupeoides TaxID=299321 RepID=A0AAY4AYF2_9TELE|nr:quinone oxidoreductase isoform X1 [Denticeps clupeoides]